MKLLHRKSGRVVEGSIEQGPDGSSVLFADGHAIGVLGATEEGLTLVEASDEERQQLVESGYALPSQIPTEDEDDAGGPAVPRA